MINTQIFSSSCVGDRQVDKIQGGFASVMAEHGGPRAPGPSWRVQGRLLGRDDSGKFEE